MEFSSFATQNWNRAFSVWIEDIQVQFQPVVQLTLNGGILRRARNLTKASAGLVTIFFLLHCSKPRASVTTHHSATPDVSLPEGVVIDSSHVEIGAASWYGETDGFSGKQTASGEAMDPAKLTCAHRTLPFGSFVQIKNIENGHTVILRVNDRGPFTRGRVIDVSAKAAQVLGFVHSGTTQVEIRSVKKDGSPATQPLQEAENPYVIQVASLSDPANVSKLTKELQNTYGQVALKNATPPGLHSVTRVQVGTYATMEEAKKAADQIAKQFGDRGVEPFITRRY